MKNTDLFILLYILLPLTFKVSLKGEWPLGKISFRGKTGKKREKSDKIIKDKKLHLFKDWYNSGLWGSK